MKFRAICENHLFSKAYAKGKRAVSSALAVYVLPDFAAKRLAKTDTRKQMKNRYGLTVSTKIGGAVVRSRLRRVMRAALQMIEKEYSLNVGFLVVIAARSEMTKCSSIEIKRQLKHAFQKLGLLK
jgi:ribonuclease P protein component